MNTFSRTISPALLLLGGLVIFLAIAGAASAKNSVICGFSPEEGATQCEDMDINACAEVGGTAYMLVSQCWNGEKKVICGLTPSGGGLQCEETTLSKCTAQKGIPYATSAACWNRGSSSSSSSSSSSDESHFSGSWNITDLDFSPRVKTNVKTGKNTLKIVPTFKYTGDTDVTFGKSYIWSMACMLSDGTTSTDISRKEFSTGTSNVTVTDGQTVKSLMVVELDNKYLKPLRRGKLTMTCSLGYAKPASYEKLSMGTEGSVTMSYVLKLKGYRWIIEGWNF